MSQSILAKRYAKALFDLAVEGKLVDKIEADLVGLNNLNNESADFASFVANPVIPRSEKEYAMQSVLKNAKANDLTVKFFVTLAANSRLDVIDSIYTEYKKLVLEYNNQAIARVVSAKTLTKAHITNIKKALNASSGKKITIEPEVDEKIIGGLIVKMGSVMLDASVSGKLNKLEALSKSAIANS